MSGEENTLIGTFIGSYQIKKKIGEGSYGKVYLGVHPTIERNVAVKVLNYEFSKDKDIANRFIIEAKAVNKIAHPNIIQVFDFGTLPDSRLYYIMEYVEGRELSEILEEEGILEMDFVDTVFLQIVSGLDAAHDAGIVHRDLKPGNILITQKKDTLSIKIVDFGIAKLIESKDKNEFQTGAGELMGTPAYMSPEQARGESDNISRRSDVYSLGVIVFQMLSGKLPIANDKSIADLIVSILQDKPPLLKDVISGIPDGMSEVINKTLEKAPNKRYATAGEFYSEFSKTKFNPLLSLGKGYVPSNHYNQKNLSSNIPLFNSKSSGEQKLRAILTKSRKKRRNRTLLYTLLASLLLTFIILSSYTVYRKRLQKKQRLKSVRHEKQLNIGFYNVGKRSYKYISHSSTFAEHLSYKNRLLTTDKNPLVADFSKLTPKSKQFNKLAELSNKVESLVISSRLLCHPILQDKMARRKNSPLFIRFTDLKSPIVQCVNKIKYTGLYLDLSSLVKGTSISFLKDLKNLKGVFLNSCKLSKENGATLSLIKTLTSLSLNNSSFEEKFLEQIALIPKLKRLFLRGTKISDDDLVFIKDFKQLSVISLDNTNISDNGLRYISQNSNLSEIYLLNTKVTKEGVKSLSKLTKLRKLSLAFLKLNAKDLDFLINLKKLEFLSLGGTKINDIAIIYLRNLTHLKTIYLYGTKVTNTGLLTLSHIKSIENLYLDNTSISDAGLAHLKWDLNLKILSLSNTKITLNGLLQLKRLNKLKKIVLKHTGIGCEAIGLITKYFPNVSFELKSCKYETDIKHGNK